GSPDATDRTKRGSGLSRRRSRPPVDRPLQPAPVRRRRGSGDLPMRLLTVLLLAACLPAQQKDDWPQFRGNHALTGVATSNPTKTLKLLWTYDAGEPVESSAAIADGVVYVGSGAGFLSAVDLATGKARWKYKVSQEGVGESSPAV